jgi:hypothetical protein
LPWIPRRGVESRLTSVWSPLGKLFIRQHAPASRGGNVPNYEVAKHSLRLLLCMHDTYLSLSKPGTRQQKFKDMFPLPFHTISLYLHGGKMWQECQVSWGVTIRACSLRGFLQAQRDLIRCFFLHVLQLRSMFPGFLILQSCNQYFRPRPRPPPRPLPRPTVPQPERLKAMDLAMEDIGRCCEMLRCTDRKMNLDEHRWTTIESYRIGHEIFESYNCAWNLENSPGPTSWMR